MQNILLIGGTGFIGTNFVKHLCEEGYLDEFHLVIVSRHAPLFVIQHPELEYIDGDYRDTALLDSLFREHKFSKVFHLASSTVPVISNQTIFDDINNDLGSTIILLETMRNYKCTFIMYVSSAGALYGNAPLSLAKKESEVCDPISSYGILKWSIEQYIKLFHRHHGIEYLIPRLSNVYGDYHRSDVQGLINIAIRKAIHQETLEVWGDGHQEKDYLYVKDAVKIMHKLLIHGHKNITLNIGSGQSVSINVIITLIKEIEKEFEIRYIETVTSDVQNIFLDTNLLRSLITNLQLTGLREGIRKTYKWEKCIIEEKSWND
ncbi:NAD-dependent epimerase/dehydratase family protein [Rhabdobacter roseus]|uniref:UDP-glucose 4-epimerase n=1 Tax=Rhabdobacter roseus TaxID=1655419 RepID=A0A840TU95_9BACT|nr:NAD-dependent epimerase/dehydratase family protein [Rhabdobacter roseus]MBB5283259.1 UDP-glucose 4-epimerase [Rhabdobacter roseus]